jgi:TonB-linked SusC/RagA family outer membrane protein
MKKVLLLMVMVLSASWLMAQQKSVSGKVTDTRNEPVPYASVKIKGAKTGVAADVNGEFKIFAKKGDVLEVSGVGVTTKEVTVGDETIINVQVERAVSNIEGVVVTGYTSKSKKSNAGSTAQVAIDEIRTSPIASFDQLLQGSAPGINVRAGSGQPGAAAKVQIRGVGSIIGSTTPLYIVDGIQINAADFATLNQGDFETVTVLKDAASAAVYGSRGANGVIVVTTRRGKIGPIKISYDVQYGNSYWPRSKNRLMNTNEKLDYEIVNGNPNGFSSAEIDSLRHIETDWEDVFFQTGKTISHQLSASGGNEKTRYYASLSYFDQTGVVRETAVKRYTGRFNIDNTQGNWKFGMNATFGYSQYTNTNEGDEYIGSPLNAIRWSLPYLTPYDKDGNYMVDPTVNGQPNALQEMLENRTSFPQGKAIANVYVEYKFPFLKGLSARTNWGFDYTQNETEVYYDKSTYTGQQQQGGNGSLSRGFNRNFRYIGTTSLTYKSTFGKDKEHDLTASVFIETINNKFKSFGYTGYGLLLPFRNEAGITQGTPDNGYIASVAGGGTENALISYFTDIQYGFKNRYFLNVAMRRDGSSRFGANNQFANFPTAGASWILSDEPFMETLRSKVDLLKVKASYGVLGNQSGIGDFLSRPLFGRSTYAGVTGLALGSAGNPDLKWERKSTFNVGVEFGLFKNRLSGTIEYFRSVTDQLLSTIPLSGTTGFGGVIGNVGKLENKGFEVQLKTDVLKTRNFRWTVDGNFTLVRNKVLEYPDRPDFVGRALNTFYLVKYAGVDPANGDALYYDKTGKITNIYNPDDRQYFGTGDAPHYGGITNTFNYKGVELSVFWVYSWGNELFNYDRVNVENPAYSYSGLSTSLLHEWRQPGDITDIPRADASIFEANTTRFLENGGFWRLRNVMLSYNFQKGLLQKLKLNSMRVFAQGQNLATITNFKGYDPEVPSTTLIGAQYPTLKTVTIGLNVGF